jgi:hypothetical protein
MCQHAYRASLMASPYVVSWVSQLLIMMVWNAHQAVLLCTCIIHV